jgi:chromosome segregation ATPase
MAPAKQGATPDVKLSEVMLFVEWLTPAMNAIDKGAEIPESPQLGPGEVATWIQTIRTLEDRRRESEEIRLNLESEKIDREAYVGRLTQQLQTTIAEATATQGTLQEVQREVAGYKEILAQVGNLVGEVARYDGLIRAATSEILSKSTQLNTLTGPFKELAQSLKSAVSKSPAK